MPFGIPFDAIRFNLAHDLLTTMGSERPVNLVHC